MSSKKIFVIVICALLAGLMLGAGVYAAVSYGSQEDPLITKSYVDTVLVPQLEQDFAAELEAMMPDSPENSGDFVLLSLENGQKVVCGIGCEIILREGSGLCFAVSGPAMVDTTGGASVEAGGYLMANHLYVVSGQGNGFTAYGTVTKVLIKGEYTVE